MVNPATAARRLESAAHWSDTSDGRHAPPG